MKIHRMVVSASVTAVLSLSAVPAFADCSTLPSWSQLRSALQSAVAATNGGLGFNMWATLVANDGTVCAVAFSGHAFTDQWLGSRVISAQKANTANDFSLDGGARATSLFPHGLALSTANLSESYRILSGLLTTGIVSAFIAENLAAASKSTAPSTHAVLILRAAA